MEGFIQRTLCTSKTAIGSRLLNNASRPIFTVSRKPNMDDKANCRKTSQSVAPLVENLPMDSVTSWISDLVANTTSENLTPVTIARSKRMFLDTLGVGILGSETEISHTVIQWASMQGEIVTTKPGSTLKSTIWGPKNISASPSISAFINGINIHSMDFDDTWYPATHPSGPVLPAILALTETMTGSYHPTLEDILVAYNVGIEVQGLLLRCSNNAREIPWRFHPPAVVGVMGSAAASARLLGLGPRKCRHALAIAASFAGAPMANAGTTTKPLHTGKAARFGLESALLADHGMEGNDDILDMSSGFGAFYDDYDPVEFLESHADHKGFLLDKQDIAIKRFPAHLGMHWAIDATTAVRDEILKDSRSLTPDQIQEIEISAPKSKYINRPLPSTEHEARHSFQFNVCTTLLDGEVIPQSFFYSHRRRHSLETLLKKTKIVTPTDNVPNFDEMYISVKVKLNDGRVIEKRCDTPYGHWRNPLSENDLEKKFMKNTSCLPYSKQKNIIESVKCLDQPLPSNRLLVSLQH